MKGNRTARQFIEAEQGKLVKDLPNLSIVSYKRFIEFVDGLESFKGHDDDKRRKKKRKELLKVERYEEKEFVPRDLTQTSQLVRMGAQLIRKAFQNCREQPVIVSLPGSVTAAVRRSWNVLGCLSGACPQVLDDAGLVRTKTEIRDITHLHHALDACVLGLASHFIPNNGRVWELIVKRKLNDPERKELLALGVFGFDAENRFQMRDVSEDLKNQIRKRLAEKRVVQHVPSRMHGLRVEQNIWRVVAVKDGEAVIQQRIRQADGSRPLKRTEEKLGKLLGVKPTSLGKLQQLKGALVIPDNYGIALDPEPTIIPFHKVWTRLHQLTVDNENKPPRVARNGQLIKIANGRYKGIWRIFSLKATLTTDLGEPDVVRLQNKGDRQKREVQLKTLIRDGLEILPKTLTGVATCPTTSSA